MDNIGDNKLYKELRDEWSSGGLVRTMAERSLGEVCYNCGSTEAIELHHVVPLKCGGTNNLSNIVVLCHKCHCAAHHGRHIRDYCNKKITGRPHKVNSKEFEDAIIDYINCKIGGSECKKRMGVKKGTHIADSRYYKQVIKERGIKSIKNNIDLIRNKRGDILDGDRAGYIIYINGNVEYKYYGE